PPRPDLRAHVLDRAYAGRAQHRLGRHVEIRRIDADENVGALRLEPPDQVAPELQQPRQVAQHLGEPHDRKLLGPIPRRAARGDHLLAGDAVELGVREPPLQRGDQAGAQRIAGFLAGDERESERTIHAAGPQRATPRVLFLSVSSSGSISGCSDTRSASAAIASSSFSPRRYTTRYASRILRICSAEKPRRFKPSALMPRGSAGRPAAVT